MVKNNIAVYHRTGELVLGDINLATAISITHRQEDLSAFYYTIDRFKQVLPNQKI